jgi:hypothetical protein
MGSATIAPPPLRVKTATLIMLTIRDKQLEAFDQAATERFVATAHDHLLAHYPGPSAAIGGSPHVLALVRRGILKARSYRIESRGAVLALLELWIQFGENFERSPLRRWTSNFLAHPLLPGETKVALIRDRHAELTGGAILVAY